MPLFGKRTDKKYDKDFTQAKVVKADPKKSMKSVKPSKEIVTKAVALPAIKQIKAIPSGIYSSVAGIIIRPHITEKTGILSQMGVYTFQVDRNANKQTIARAVKELYKVNPVKIAVIKVPMKNIFVRGKRGTIPGMKKAIVTVKKGEKIDFV
ncbi:MAG: 50S ribosomal protein L23 [Patescibacteria group bacterium]